jgi:hypothetical protein
MATYSKLPSGLWRVQVRLKGHAPVTESFRTMAECWAVKIKDQIRSGAYLDTGAAEGRILREHLAWYLETVTARKAASSVPREASRIRALQEHPDLKHCTLATLTPSVILRYVDSRKADGMTATTITRELALLSHAINAGTGLLRIALPHGNPVEMAHNSLRFTKTLLPQWTAPLVVSQSKVG